MTAAHVAAAPTVAGAPRLTWTWTRFDALSGRDVYDMLALRNQVFVVEQACVFTDADYCDQHAWHLLGRAKTGDLLAYLRGLDAGVKFPEPSIGRVVVAEGARGDGLGRLLMEEGIRLGRRSWPGAAIVISAQQRLEAFYASLGFVPAGETYIEDGIEHIEMHLSAVM